jgi:glutamate formiminotransferase/formiminotetrahydrofolate cyclodeaminase
MKSSISDVGVAALCVQTAMQGAYLNVKINAASLDDKDFADSIIEQGKELIENMQFKMKKIMDTVYSKIG